MRIKPTTVSFLKSFYVKIFVPGTWTDMQMMSLKPRNVDFQETWASLKETVSNAYIIEYTFLIHNLQSLEALHVQWRNSILRFYLVTRAEKWKY